MSTFVDRLATALTLTIGAAAHEIEARDIERFDVTMTPHGHEVTLTFSIVCVSDPAEDTVFATFVGDDEISAALTIKPAYDEVEATAESVVLKGLVTARSVVEGAVDDVAGAPVLLRSYTIAFADRAAVLWAQHRPTRLYVDTTYQAMFADNLPAGVTLTHGWAASSVQRPVIAIGLGVDENEASFRDFVLWLLDRENASLTYDVAGDSYKIVDTKATPSATLELEAGEVSSVEIVLPRLRRAKPWVLNASTEASQAKKEGTNEQATTGVRADYLVRTPIASQQDARATLENNRAKQHMAGLRLVMAAFPSKPMVPGLGVTLVNDFSEALYTNSKSFRVVRVSLSGRGTGEEGGVEGGPTNRYELSYVVELEQQSDPVFDAPAHVAPRYPFVVEGKVVSETGAADEETYQIYQESATSLDMYKVAVPLFENKKVIVQFEPMTLSGQFYFPAYKGERVLVSLDLLKASFAGYLDWRPGARLPLDTQGNHLLLGKKAASQTSIKHAYVDAKPEFTIVRTSDKDEQSIKVFEGTLFMITHEKP